MLFDPDVGLGLEIVRYNIGGSNTTLNATNSMRPFAAVPSVILADGTYNWTLVSIVTRLHLPYVPDIANPACLLPDLCITTPFYVVVSLHHTAYACACLAPTVYQRLKADASCCSTERRMHHF